MQAASADGRRGASTRQSIAKGDRAVTLTQLCSLSDVSEDRPFRAEIDGFGYAVFQFGEAYYVTADLCSHGPGSLSEGYLEDYEIECPFHQGRFDIRSGEATLAPCQAKVQTWPVVVQSGAIFIALAASEADTTTQRCAAQI
jgi:nitrite reductase/ring-hydroxylating ferredoxin subunit